jgi:hypothetical protein
VERIPDTPDTLVHTLDWLCDLLQFIAAGVAQEFGLLHDLLFLQAADTDGLFTAVYICALDDGVFSWARRDGDFDLRVCAGEGWEVVFEK